MPRRRLRAVAAAIDRLDHATALGVLVFLVILLILLNFGAAAVGLLTQHPEDLGDLSDMVGGASTISWGDAEQLRSTGSRST